MFSAAVASVIRRRLVRHNPSFFFILRGCGFSTTTVSGGGGGGGGRAAGVPWLLLSSPGNPESRHLYKLTKDEESGRNSIEPQRELSLPQMAGYDFIGSSNGLLLTKPRRRRRSSSSSQHSSTKIMAINPLTGEQPLRLPPCDPLLRQADVSSDKELGFFFSRAKAILSPSCDTVVMLSPFRYVTASFARLHLYGNDDTTTSSSWTPLPIRFPTEDTDVHDLIFHKGRLHVVNFKGDLAIYGGDDDDDGFKGDLSSAVVSLVFSSADIIDIEYYACRKIDIRMCLAESPNGDDLFLLARLYCSYFSWTRTSSFRIFKLQYNNKKNDNINVDNNCDGGGGGGGIRRMWAEVDNLGDVAMFVGPNRAVSFSASDFPVLAPNSIYFTDDSGDRDGTCTDTGVFYLEDGALDFFGYHLHYPAPIWLETVAAAATPC